MHDRKQTILGDCFDYCHGLLVHNTLKHKKQVFCHTTLLWKLLL